MINILRFFWWHKHAWRWIAISFFASYAVFARAEEEVPTIEPVYKAGNHTTFDWLPSGILRIDDEWTRHRTSQSLYDPATGLLTPQQTLYFPSYPTIQTGANVAPPRNRSGRIGLMYASPNGRYVAYGTHSPLDGDYASLAIVDLQTGKGVTLDDVLLFSLYSSYTFNVKWGAASNALIVSTVSDYTRRIVYYVGGFSEDINAAKSIELTEGGDLDEVVYFHDAWDVDSTGRYLLAEGYLIHPSDEPGFLRLLTMDMTDLSYQIVAADRYFMAARFGSPDDNSIFYFSKTGIFSYNRTKMRTKFLTERPHYTDVVISVLAQPVISPDGRYLATQFYEETGFTNDYNDIFVLPIPPTP